MPPSATIYLPDAVYRDGALRFGEALAVSEAGEVCSEAPPGAKRVALPGRVLFPGLVNAHSHAFQRLLRGRVQYLTPGREADDFWSWREQMYRVATALTPDDVFAVSCQAFLEMLLAGITTVGEFHYLHHAPDGTPYDDPSTLALEVVRAARAVGIRIVLLRVGYARAGFGVSPNPRQARFLDPDVETYLKRVEALRAQLAADPLTTVGLAPHSVRAVPKHWLEILARAAPPLVHMHVSEQPKELEACQAEHRRTPVELLDEVGLLRPGFTAVHAVHVGPGEVARLAQAQAAVCACPSTERDLGDGVVPADAYLRAGVKVALGSDSQATIDLLDEARQLEGNLRLQRGRRAVLDAGTGAVDGLAARLLDCATVSGAHSLGLPVGALRPGAPADFFTVDRTHPTLAGLEGEGLLAGIVFAAPPGSVQEVAVQGVLRVEHGRHPESAAVLQRYASVVGARAP